MSESSNHEGGLAANQNVKWFRLGGTSKDAILRSIELNDTQNAEKQELSDLAGRLGLKFLVARTDTFYGHSAHTPEVFASPFPNEDEFYMMCPIGDGRKDGQTHFVPEDATELEHEDISKLESALFNAWGGHIPIIRKEPIPLHPREEGPSSDSLDNG